ncbi:MAG TPA: hypothetical protein VFQ47_01190 [Nitrososphaera sp.]|nr:hypothetical protein [Nitrososphaera sp.]
MLRNIDKKRIYQEEVYRYEVRAQLDKTVQKNNKAEGKIWTFVNSAFFLWFLSSVVIGGISFSYVKWEKQREIEREQRERAALAEQENIQRTRKLDAEISSRLTYFFYSQDIPKHVNVSEVLELEKVVEVPRGDSTLTTRESLKGRVPETEAPKTKADNSRLEDNSGETGYVIPISEDAIMSLNNPNASIYKSGEPEYANRSLRSLLEELKAIVPQQEKNEISLALDRFTGMQPKFIQMVKTPNKLSKEGKPNMDIETFNKFCESVNLKRWAAPCIPVRVTTESEVLETVRYVYR